jgi:cation-transporting ATPase I
MALASSPHVVHSLPGRVRFHLPGGVADLQTLRDRLGHLPGVREVRASDLTGNVLVTFDPATTSEQAILDAARELSTPAGTPTTREHVALRHLLPARATVTRGPDKRLARARIAVPGIERNPELAQRVARLLAHHPATRNVSVSQLSGRVLVEYEQHEADIDDLLAQLTSLDLPDVPERDLPTSPLDPRRLIQSAMRTAGAVLGLSLVAYQQLTGTQELLVPRAFAAQVTNVIGVLRGFPAIRNGTRRLLGPNAADVAFTLPNIFALALSDSPLGLAVTGVEALRVLTEALARRRAWERYEQRLGGPASAQPGETIRLESSERLPLSGHVIEGTGTATGRHGQPLAVAPGTDLPAGVKLFGGPFVVQLHASHPFAAQQRPVRLAPTVYDRYLGVVAPMSLAYGMLTGLVTRSLARTLQALVLLSPRVALIGVEAADLDASARVLRAGVTVVGTRPERTIRRPDTLLLDGARLVTDGYELASVLPLTTASDTADILAWAAAVAAAAGSPWGGAFRAATAEPAEDGSFDGQTATAVITADRYWLGPVQDWSELPAALRLQQRGNHPLLLRSERHGGLGVFVLRPRLAPGVADLVQMGARHHIELALLAEEESLTAREISRRAGIPLVNEDALTAIERRQAQGGYVAFASDQAEAGAAFAACDLAIGVVEPRSPLPARADLLAPDLTALAAILDTGARRTAIVRDSTLLSAAANVAAAGLGLRGLAGITAAVQLTYGTSLAVLGDGWLRMLGGERRHAALAALPDPHPERWGRLSTEETLRLLGSTEHGLTSAQALGRRYLAPPARRRAILLPALLDQLKSPLTLIIGGSAVVSLFLGSVGNAAIIGATVAANTLVTTWQETQVGRAAEALEQLGTPTARVLRDGEAVTIPASDVVLGDVLLLASGDHISADARVITARNLEVDEAALTGESLPVRKYDGGGALASRIVLAGSDVTTGSGRAVVIAVGKDTRMGALAAALETDLTSESPLGARLGAMLRQTLPLAAAAGVIVTASGVLRGGSLAAQAAIGASLAVTAIPEGLGVLAQIGEAGVARRLAAHNALVRRLSAVEALGRVDVACTDKTGTLTEGRLTLHLVADAEQEATLPGELREGLREVLRVAALASPRPDAPGASAHPTDVAVVRGAQAAGLRRELEVERSGESPFDPIRAFHATLADGHLAVKGAPEVLVARCTHVRHGERLLQLDDAGRERLLGRARQLAQRGLRTLMVAEGPADATIEDPQELAALGFIGISDPLRPTVRESVRICHEAGIRVVMITGDHPDTARAIAREAGLLNSHGDILSGAELAELQNGELDERLEQAVVIARATPLDKVRIIESLQRHSHVVAMTGDGVNDAPALRLADVGVAMGRGGTEVARQTADVVLVDDDFTTLVEALVEGRSYWRNVRRALGLLLGGNLGELGLVVGASLLGLGSPLTARQVLGVNIISDVLPGLAVSLQEPRHHWLAGLAREGTASLGRPLRNDILRRASTTAAPSLAAFLIALGSGGFAPASSVAFASIIATQLAQTLDAARSRDGINLAVAGAVFGSAGILGATYTVPPLRRFFGLTLPSPLGWTLIGASTLASVGLSRVLASRVALPTRPAQLPAPPLLRLLPRPEE